jgi:hypothetical protein
MVEPEAAQRGVLQAILELHERGIFTRLLDDFYSSILPKYFALNSPVFEEPVFGEQPEPVPIGSYARSSRDRRQRQTEYEDALQLWARRFRLTRDETETGECLPWILDFGQARCEGRLIEVELKSRTGTRMPPPGGWVRLDEPNTSKENPSDWISRNTPALREHFRKVHERQRSRSYPNPAKRKPDHYKWFVLRVCGGLKFQEIADAIGWSVGEDAVRNGVNTVRAALGVDRK